MLLYHVPFGAMTVEYLKSPETKDAFCVDVLITCNGDNQFHHPTTHSYQTRNFVGLWARHKAIERVVGIVNLFKLENM